MANTLVNIANSLRMMRLPFCIFAAAAALSMLLDSSRSPYEPPGSSPVPLTHGQRKIRKLQSLGLGQLSDPKTVSVRADSSSELATKEIANDPLRGTATCAEKNVRLTHAIGFDKEMSIWTKNPLWKNPLLRPVSITMDEDEKIRFGGLDADLIRRAYLSRRIAILGDSTLQHLYTCIMPLLIMVKESHPTLPLLEHMTLERASNVVANIACKGIANKRRLTSCLPQVIPHHVTSLDPGHATMFARTHPDWHFGDQKMNVLTYLQDFAPSVVIANIGLHMLHMENYGRNVNNIGKWLGYENKLEELAVAAKEAGVQMLLLKTTNFVCGRKYIGDFARGYQLYSNHDTEALGNCIDSYKVKDPGEFTDEEIERYCSDAVMDEDGAKKLNERLYRFVDASKELYSPLMIEIFNDHHLQSCQSTKESDGRHHAHMNLAQVRVLANLIDCLDP